MNKDYSNNRTLIIDLKKGDENAYAYLMDAYYQKLCVYAESLSRDVYTAEDIVQNIFLKVWEQRSKLKEIYPIKSYLYRSVYNEFIDQYRKKRNLMAVENEYIRSLNIILEEDTRDLKRLIAIGDF